MALNIGLLYTVGYKKSPGHAVLFGVEFKRSKTVGTIQGRHFNFFLGGQIFVLFFNATGLLKNWKNSTLYVVI